MSDLEIVSRWMPFLPHPGFEPAASIIQEAALMTQQATADENNRKSKDKKNEVQVQKSDVHSCCHLLVFYQSCILQVISLGSSQ